MNTTTPPPFPSPTWDGLKKNQDQPAYPVENLKEFDATGLTKRELLAAMAMQGWYASMDGVDISKVGYKNVAKHCINQADALLAELDKENVCEWVKHGEGHFAGCNHKMIWGDVQPHCSQCGRKTKEVK